MAIFKALKKFFLKEYNTKNLEKVKTIIRWQISRDTTAETMKIDQSVFIRDLIIEESLTNCNATIILIKAGLAIDMRNINNYKKTKLLKYQ